VTLSCAAATLRGGYEALIVLYGPVVLLDKSLLRRQLLFGYGVLREKGRVTGDVNERIREKRLIARQLPLCLRQHCLIGARIDFD
jgi:hypothetical protein